MITTETSNIQGLISSNAKLSAGMDFMRLMRSEGLLDARLGLFPAIMGGAVRDGLFLNREINDIDIFLFRDVRSPLITNGISTLRGAENAMLETRQNLLAWFEDQEIEYQSLLSTAAASYNNSGLRFLEIFQFVWHETTIQIMIPTGQTLPSNLDNLLRAMPIFSGVSLTMDNLRMFDTTLAHYFLPAGQYFVATERDLPYLQIKAPGAITIPVNTAREAVMLTLYRFMESVPLGQVNTNDGVMMNVNSVPRIVKRAMMHKLGLDVNQVNQMSAVPIHTN